MSLRTSSPYRHPKTGIYWFRKAVPDRLRHLVGRGIYQRSLGTKDVNEAKARFAVVSAEVAARWDALAAEPGRLTPFRKVAVAGEYYRWLVAKHRENPGEASLWVSEVARDEARMKPVFNRPSTAHLLLKSLPRFLEDRGIPVDKADLYDLAKECAKAGVRAKRTLARHANGDYREDPDAATYPAYVPLSGAKQAQPGSTGPVRLSLAAHWDDFVRERKLSLGTQKRWKPLLEKLERHLARPDLATAAPVEIGEWKRLLLKGGLSHKTVREGHIACAKSFYSWAVGSGIIEINPAGGIVVAQEKVQETEASREPDLTDAEAHLILSESLRPCDPRTSPEFARAKRWVPWLCAYTGARVNEITQLRKCDLIKKEVGEVDVWLIQITPEAGSTKNGKIRKVPLHPHMLDQGFPLFVAGQPEGPLFYNPARPRHGSAVNAPYKKQGERLATWVREIGVDDPNVSPNHGWRHRFKFVARDVKMDLEIREGIAGHAPRTEGEAYGSIPLRRVYEEICLIPRYRVEAPMGPLPDTKARRERNAKRVATAVRSKVRQAAGPAAASAMA